MIEKKLRGESFAGFCFGYFTASTYIRTRTFTKKKNSMESYGQIIIGAIVSIVGTGFGWFMNQTSEYWSDKRNRNKKLKSLLSYLLEIFQLMVKSDVNRFTDKVANKVLKRINVEQITPEVREHLQKSYEQMGLNLFNPILTNDFEKLKNGYEKSLADLSEIDPIRAYWLRGKDEIFENLQKLNQYIEDLKVQWPNEFVQLGSQVGNIVTAAKKTLIKETLKDLEDEIIQISSLIGRRQRKDIIDTQNNIKSLQDKVIDKLLNDSFSMIEEAMKK